MSATDVEKGSRWEGEISAQLDCADVGIICLTPDNLDSRWILFESGALSKKVKASEARVYTYLYKLRPADVQSPLSIFQHTLAEKEETRRLIFDIKEFGKTANITDQALNRLFDRMWPDLQEALARAPQNQIAKPRDLREITEEILEVVRGIAKREERADAKEKLERLLLARYVTKGLEANIGGESLGDRLLRAAGEYTTASVDRAQDEPGDGSQCPR